MVWYDPTTWDTAAAPEPEDEGTEWVHAGGPMEGQPQYAQPQMGAGNTYTDAGGNVRSLDPYSPQAPVQVGTYGSYYGEPGSEYAGTGPEGAQTRHTIDSRGHWFDPRAYFLGGTPGYTREREKDFIDAGQWMSAGLGQVADEQRAHTNVSTGNIRSAADVYRNQGDAIGSQVSQSATNRGMGLTGYAQGQGNLVQSYGAAAASNLDEYVRGAANTVASDAVRRGEEVQDIGAHEGSGMKTMGMMGMSKLGEYATGQNISGEQNLRKAGYTAGALAGLETQEGPSAAQAQLRAGLDAAQASNLAMARSGRGWGQSASALTQAQAQNAAASQQAVNQATQLRAQENAAWRERQAANLGAAGGMVMDIGQGQSQRGAAALDASIDAGLRGYQHGTQLTVDSSRAGAELANTGEQNAAAMGVSGVNAANNLGVNAITAGANIGVTGSTAGQNLVSEGERAGADIRMRGLEGKMEGEIAAAGFGREGLADVANTTRLEGAANMQGLREGTNVQITQSGMMSEQQRQLVHTYAIEKGISFQQAAQELQLLGAGIGAAGTLGSALIGAA